MAYRPGFALSPLLTEQNAAQFHDTGHRCHVVLCQSSSDHCCQRQQHRYYRDPFAPKDVRFKQFGQLKAEQNTRSKEHGPPRTLNSRLAIQSEDELALLRQGLRIKNRSDSDLQSGAGTCAPPLMIWSRADDCTKRLHAVENCATCTRSALATPRTPGSLFPSPAKAPRRSMLCKNYCVKENGTS